MIELEIRKSGTKSRSMVYEEVLGSIEIRKPAAAGTLESNDYQVAVEPGKGDIEFAPESVVINQYGNQIKRVVIETLENLGVKDVRTAIVDRGALDYTIRARVEGVVPRTTGQYDNLLWGGVVR